MDPSLLPKDIVEADERFPETLAACGDMDGLLRVKGAYVGREGSHAARLMSLLKEAPKDQKRELGASINALKNKWEEALKARQADLEEAKKRGATLAQSWDPDLPPPMPQRGAMNPLNRLVDRLVDVFRPLGYHVEEGPEVETEAHNFDGLNIPEDHPARSSADTFYFAGHPGADIASRGSDDRAAGWDPLPEPGSCLSQG
jgi:phenylalanyl-tRNA synthetase alpha chain